MEIDEKKIIRFEHGLPGFAESKRYIIITDDNPESVYCWLQSVDDSDIALVIIDSFHAMPNYDPLVEEEELKELGEVDISDIAVFNVAVIAKDIYKSTINLKAPIIINEKTWLGKQIVVNNDEYEVRHNLFEALKSGGGV
jgi:flagellar assembly factor FliW